MRIGLMSDTHRNTKAIDKAVESAGKVDLWLHAGDLVLDADYLAHVHGQSVINVAGNGDCFSPGEAPDEEVCEIGGKRIFLTHGHLYGAKGSMRSLVKAAKQNRASIVVFGHSHVACVEKMDGILLINPGSLAYPRDGKGWSFMVMELEKGKEPEVYHYHLSR